MSAQDLPLPAAPPNKAISASDARNLRCGPGCGIILRWPGGSGPKSRSISQLRSGTMHAVHDALIAFVEIIVADRFLRPSRRDGALSANVDPFRVYLFVVAHDREDREGAGTPRMAEG